VYLVKARIVKLEKQPLLGNVSTKQERNCLKATIVESEKEPLLGNACTKQ
jgi:hypothetical protein